MRVVRHWALCWLLWLSFMGLVSMVGDKSNPWLWIIAVLLIIAAVAETAWAGRRDWP